MTLLCYYITALKKRRIVVADRLMENTVSSFSVCSSFCLQQISVAFLSATINCRCLKLKRTFCSDMPYGGILFCTNQTSTSC